MNRQCSASLLTFAVVMAATAFAAEPGKVEVQGWKASTKLESVVAGYLTELNGKYKLRLTEATFQPGGYVGDHHHLAPGIRLVTSGELTFVRGNETTVYKAGDTFFEAGDVTHTVYNRGSAPVVLLIFEVVPVDLQGSTITPVAATSR